MSWTDVPTPNLVYDYQTLGVVAFIQDDSNKSIVNGALSHPLLLTDVADLEITTKRDEDIGGPCDYDFIGLATVTNISDYDAPSFTATLIVNDQVIQTIASTELLMANESVLIEFDATQVSEGSSLIEYELDVSGGDTGGLNNTTEILIGKAGNPVSTFYRGFDDEEYIGGQIPFKDIIDRPFTQSNFTVSGIDGLDGTKNSFLINFYDWNLDDYEMNGSYTIADKYLVPDDGAVLSFDRGATTWNGSQDRLQVQVSTDCGLTYTDVWDAVGSDLATAPEQNSPTLYFVPIESDQWETAEVDISDFAGQEIIVRFYATSDHGDLCFIDNISIRTTTAVNSIISKNSITINPNPAVDYVDIAYDQNISYLTPARLEVYNLEGILVAKQELKEFGMGQNFSVRDFQSGIYLFKIILDKYVHVEKVTIID